MYKYVSFPIPTFIKESESEAVRYTNLLVDISGSDLACNCTYQLLKTMQRLGLFNEKTTIKNQDHQICIYGIWR